MFDAHRFVASAIPTPKELHCLVTGITDKAQVDTKVERNGRIVSVLLPAACFKAKSMAFKTISFDYRDTTPVFPWTANPGDIVSLSTKLCYTIHRRSNEGKLYKTSPFDMMGRLVKETRLHFLHYLETKTGLSGLTDGECELSVLLPPAGHADAQNGKVWFNGVVDLSLRARVADTETFNMLAGRAIGNRRSYGFGSVSCDDLQPQRTDGWSPTTS